MTAPHELPEARTTASTVSAQGLIDALDRLIGNGAAIAGDVIIGVAGVDLIRLDLRALLLGVQDPPEPEGDHP
jgi:hypothetical protein